MKAYYKLLALLLIVGFSTLNITSVSAQGQCFTGGCTGGASYGSALSTTSATFTQAMSCTYGGEYNTFNVTAGATYEWSMCPSDGAIAAFGDDQLTLRTTTGTQLCYSDDYCGANAKISWTATFTGQVQVLITQYYCTFTASCNTMVWRQSSPAPAGCDNTTAYGPYGSATINSSGALTTISSCSYAGEYSTISGAVSGQTLQFTMSNLLGTYITIHSGSPSGPVLATGASPLTFANTYTGTIYAHWNTNASCGLYTGCHTTTVQCMNCPIVSGCTNTSSYGSATINPSGALVTVSTCSYAGEYSTISGALPGQSLQFTMGSGGGGTYITIHTGSYNGPIVASGPSPLTYANSYTGTIYAHWNTNASCGTYFSCLTTTVQCVSCVPAGCDNTINYGQYGSATLVGDNLPLTISTCSYAGEYSPVFGAVAGQTLQFTMSNLLGTYITVRSGSPSGPVLASGASPLSFVNTYTGTIYAHWNTNASCGTYTGCHTTTVQCTSCPPPAYDPCTGITASALCGVTNTTVIAAGNGVYALGPYAPPSKERIYTFTPTTTGNYTFTVTSNSYFYYTDFFYKAASGGCNGSGWTFVQDVYNVGTSFGTAAMTAGVQYYIMLDEEFYTSGGTIVWKIDCNVPAPPNDDCSAAVPVNLGAGGTTTFTGNTQGATASTDGSFTAYPTVWHAFTITSCATVVLDYCSTSPAFQDVWINLATACPAFSFTPQGNYAGCGNGNYTVTYNNLAAGTYWIPVLGNEAGYVTPGPYVLTVTATACPPPPVNDACAGAIAIPCGGTVTGNTATGGFTPDFNTCGGTGSNGAWYSITPTVNSFVTLSMCGSGYDTRLSVYSGSCSSLNSIGCNDDYCGASSQLNSILMNAGTTYYILVNGYTTGSNGAFTLTATCVPSDCAGQPNPGNTICSVANPVCGQFTLSLQNVTVGSNVTYQWESSPNGSTWTPIAGATDATLTTGQASTTYYHCVVTCPSNPVGISNSYQVVSNTNFMACYCQPQTYCGYPDIITNVTFGGINRTSTCDGASSNGYSVWNTPNPVVLMGVATPISVSTGGDVEGIAVWIDYNHSGSFDPSEAVLNGYAGSNPAVYTGSVTIPTSAAAGQTMMRVRCSYAGNALPAGPCANYTYGETEDYWLQIIPPNATSNSPVCENDSLKLFAPTAGNSFSWSTTAANAFTSTLQNPTIPVASPNDAGVYTVVVNTGTGTYSASVTVVVNPEPTVSSSSVVPFCEGTQNLSLNSTAPTAVSYNWSGPGGYSSSDEDPIRSSTTASMSGNYTVEVTDGNGCTNTSTTNVTIYALPPVDVIVIGNVHLCTGQTTSDLQATGAGVTGSYSWSTSETTDLITVTTAGTYTVVGTDLHNCINTDQVVITESAPPAAPVVTPAGPLNLCSSDGGASFNTVTLSVNNYSSDLLWSTSETSTSVSINYPDIFFAIYTDPLGCYAVSNSVIVNGFLTSEDPVDITSNIPGNTLCGGSQATLTVNGGFLGDQADWVWYEGSCSGTPIGTGNPIVVTPVGTGSHFYYARAEGYCNTTNCAVIEMIMKTVSTDPTSASASQPTVCAGDITTLSVSGGSLGTGAVWKWYAGSCNGTLVGIGSSVNVSTPATTTYYVRAEGDCNNTNCVSTTVTVRTLSTDPTSITSNVGTQICSGGSVILNVNGGSLGTNANWVWYEDACGTGTPVGTGASVTVTPSSTGVHNYYVRAEGPCNTSNCVGISIGVAIPSVAATSVTSNVIANSICTGNTITLTVNGGTLGAGAVWKWYAGGCGVGASVGTGPSVTVTPGASTTYYVRAEGLCNTTACASALVSVSNTPPSSPPPTITTAPNGICSGNGSTVACNAVSGATFYSWSAPNGTTFDGGNPSPYITTSNSVQVTFGNLPNGVSGYDICVFAGNGCGNSVTKCRYIRGRVQQPQTIAGLSNPCPNTSSVYSITSQPGADSYVWTITGNANINGVGTTVSTSGTSVTVNFLSGWTSGTLSVYAHMNCGYNSPVRTINIVSTPVMPGIIGGNAFVCPLQSSTFSIAPVSGATGYIWSTSVAGSVVTPSGTSASIQFGASIPAGSTVSVVAVGTCGNSVPRVKTISTGVANMPGTITGPTIGQCGQSGVSYSILPVGGATSYLWTASAGGSVSGPNNLSAVSINFTNAFTTCTLSVIAVNSCGNSLPRTVVVSGAPGNPGAITGGQAVCVNQIYTYSVPGSAGATAYNWGTPPGSMQVGGGVGNSADVLYLDNSGGNVTVYASNGCGNSSTSTLPISVVCRWGMVGEGTMTDASLYPNPTTGYTTLKFESATAGDYMISVLDVTGRIVQSKNVSAAEGMNMHELDLTTYAKGLYMIRMERAGEPMQLLKVTVE